MNIFEEMCSCKKLEFKFIKIKNHYKQSRLAANTYTMDTEPIRIAAADLQPHPTILKEVDPSTRKSLFHMYDLQSPIIIDYGSEVIKAGYDMNENGPCLVFRPQISKTRDPNKMDLPIKAAMNLSYDQLDFSKSNFKSPFEKNIILHFSILEQCNDYIFSEIVRPNKPIYSPIVISEPFGNPIHCRTSVLEQFFECYQVPQIMIGIDALFAYFYQVDCNLQRYQTQTSLVVQMGANTIHVFSIVGGKMDFGSVRRINVGGNNSFEIFAKTLLLKNPQLKSKLTYGFLKDIYEKYTQVAEDYIAQLRYMEEKITGKKSKKVPINGDIYHNRVEEDNRKYPQHPKLIDIVEIDFQVFLEIREEEIKRKEEMKLRMAEKLRQTIERRKQIKKKMHEVELQQLRQLREKYESGDKEAHEEVVQMFGTNKFFDKLVKKINQLEIKLGIAQQKTEQNKFSLIDIPDHELTTQKLKLKRIQVYQKNMIEVRRKKQEEKQLEEQKMKDLRENNPEVYLQQLRQKFKTVSEKVKENQRIKNELNNRKSRLKQRKMQVLARLAEEDYDENKEENEEEIQALRDPDESDHYSELEVMEAELREIDPQWNHINKDLHHLNSGNQLFLMTELVKCHQIYFEPRIAGCHQAGLIETIVCSIEQYSPETKAKLLKNIVVLGGGSVIPGLKERMMKDLTRQCPEGSEIKIKIGKGGYEGAYLGMQNICKYQKDLLSKMSFQQDLFLKNPNTYYVDNPWSNPQPLLS